MKNRRQTALLWILALLPFAMVAAAWGRLPELVPCRWNLDGTIDYSGKRMLWWLAALNPLILALLAVLPRIDPRRKNYEKFHGSYHWMQLMLVLFVDAMMAVMLVESLRPGTVDVATAVQLLAAILLMVFGNMMPKFRQNYFCGIKNAWTYASERVWSKANRLGGRLFFAAGAVCFAAAFLPAVWSFAVMLAVILAAAIVPTVMSYVWFRQEQTERETPG